MDIIRHRVFLRIAASTVAMSLSGGATSQSSERPSDSASAIASTPIRMDRNHPWKLAFPHSLFAHGESGVCLIRVQADADGVIRASQVIASSGFANLDAACVGAVMLQRLIPATENGTPVPGWVAFPITMGIKTVPGKNYRQDASAVPQIQKTCQLKVGPEYYPASSREMHQEGDCVIHVFVTQDGKPTNITVTKSMGFASLDQACALAVQHAQFAPGEQSGAPIGAWADINMSWRL